ncbi:MAG: hypothetical protein KDD13_00315 [Mangrovimonas sp.]|nr:hypothetical protein [Mangrovimonas sp.]
MKNYGFGKIVHELSHRPYEDQDYEMARDWWQWHNKDKYGNEAILEKDLLPNTGTVVMQNKTPVCMGWTYMSNSKLAYISWVVSKPKLGPRARVVATNQVIQNCEKIAEKMGARYINILSDKPGLSKIVDFAGFMPVKKHDLFVKVIEDDDI